MDDKIRAAARRAADWLEANPDKHIIGNMAHDEQHNEVPANSPQAMCWCAVGRLAKELDNPAVDLDEGSYAPINEVLGAECVTTIFTRNDRLREGGIEALRELASGESQC